MTTVREYAEQYIPSGEGVDRKVIVKQVAELLIAEAQELNRIRNTQSIQGIADCFAEARTKFQLWLEKHEIYSEGRMKFYDALAIPVRKEDVRKAQERKAAQPVKTR